MFWLKRCVSLMVVGSILAGCGGNGNPATSPISSFGEYKLDGSGLVLHVSENSGIVTYSVIDGEKKEVLSSNGHPKVSNYQKWLISWNPDPQALWIYSSDTGTYVWIRSGKEGVFTIKSVREMTEDEKATAPESLRQRVPRLLPHK